MIKNQIQIVFVFLLLVVVSMLFAAVPYFLYIWVMPQLFPLGDMSWTNPPFLVFYALLILVYLISLMFKGK